MVNDDDDDEMNMDSYGLEDVYMVDLKKLRSITLEGHALCGDRRYGTSDSNLSASSGMNDQNQNQNQNQNQTGNELIMRSR